MYLVKTSVGAPSRHTVRVWPANFGPFAAAEAVGAVVLPESSLPQAASPRARAAVAVVATAIFTIFTMGLSLPGFASGVRLVGGVGGPLT
jgi:hypothetical protein